MTQTEALRLALEALTDALDKPMWNRVQMESAITAIKVALLSRSDGEAKDEIDWKDMYEKEKRRSEMWVVKYEKDIGPLEKAGPQQEAKDEEIKNDEK